MGRIATILFAHRLGTSLEPECKMYRLLADIFNDAAMLLDCLSPAFPKGPRVLLLGTSSVLRALCGVAAGSAKASLSAHFATQGNLGELNAVRSPFPILVHFQLFKFLRIREFGDNERLMEPWNAERFFPRNSHFSARHAGWQRRRVLHLQPPRNVDCDALPPRYSSRNELPSRALSEHA
jgi:hypothetical protein